MRYRGLASSLEAIATRWGFPAAISFLPYSTALLYRGQLLTGFMMDQLAPAIQQGLCADQKSFDTMNAAIS